ncbi:MAG: hypothetical protein OSA84_05765 [Akkermansiaceae bacterium]|nr:hypothetical protein [Akkermansiaceae bacterium]
MKAVKDNNEWKEGDATWDLLGKAAAKEAGPRFTDDTLRAVRLLPDTDPWWSNVMRFSPWAAVTACGVFAALFLLNEPNAGSGDDPKVVSTVSDEQWVQIEEVAEAEMLVAAADHLDRFSDQELVSLIGF